MALLYLGAKSRVKRTKRLLLLHLLIPLGLPPLTGAILVEVGVDAADVVVLDAVVL